MYLTIYQSPATSCCEKDLRNHAGH